MRFEQLLARADDEVLEQLLGSSTVRLLNLLDPALARPRRIRELISAFRPPEELLRDQESRRLLLELLPSVEASELAGALGCRDASAFEYLRQLRVSRGSAAEGILFDHLAVVPHEVDELQLAPAIEACIPAYNLFSHQRLATRRVNNLLGVRPFRVLLHMPTGAGKTRTAMHIVAEELRRHEPGVVVWLAFSEELCEQAASEFESAWRSLGDRSLAVYRYWGSRSVEIESVSDGFMVAGLAKTYATATRQMDFMVRLADRASLVIIDEAHQSIASTYRFVLEVLVDRNPGTKLLGLTATPGRTWNDPSQDAQLAEFYGRNKVTLEVAGYPNPIEFLIQEGYLARPRFEPLVCGTDLRLTAAELSDLAGALDVPEAILERLAHDEQRNLLIVHRVEQLVASHQRIILFAASVAHARLVATVLRARAVDACAVTAGTLPGERQRIIARFKGNSAKPMVLCNYGVLTAGFDAPQTSVALIARPTKSLVLYSQMVGRATRGPRAGGNAEALIVTVVDTSLPGFGRMSDAFSNWEDVW